MLTIEISLNGEARQVESSTVAELISELSLAGRRVAVELNKNIVRREQFASTALTAGDVVEVVHFVGGG